MDTRDVTDPELIRRARDTADQAAWVELVSLYHPKLLAWATRRGLQDDDAEEAASRTLLQLHRYLPRFDYDQKKGSFRGWLRTVLRHCIADLAKEWETRPKSTEDTLGHLLISNAEDRSLESDLLEMLASEEEFFAYRAAKERASKRVEEHVWLSWALTREQDLSASEASEQLGIRVANLYVYINRVNKIIEEEFRGLDR